MKKGIFNVILIVLLVTNLILTAIIVFAVVPSVITSNEMVKKVAQAVDLEKEGQYQHTYGENISIDDTATFTFEDKFTSTLSPGEDGKSHIAVFKLTLTLNKKDENYSKYKDKLGSYEELMRSKIDDVISKYTVKDVVNSKDAILVEIRDTLREMFNNSTFIYSVGFADFLTQ